MIVTNRKIPKIPDEVLARAVRPDDPEDLEPSYAPQPKPRRPRRRASFGSSAVYYLGWLWQFFLLALVIGVIAVVIWILGVVIPHLPGLAHSDVGHWIIIASHWEGHWFARIPNPTKAS